MKHRIILWSLLFTVAFFWLTARAHWSLRELSAPVFRRALQWSEPTPVRGAGLTAEELNSIDIYRAAQPATVYITSTTVRRWYSSGTPS